MKWLKLRSARFAVIVAAKCVESSYEPSLVHAHDPDDLQDLREAVKELRRLESGEAL